MELSREGMRSVGSINELGDWMLGTDRFRGTHKGANASLRSAVPLLRR